MFSNASGSGLQGVNNAQSMGVDNTHKLTIGLFSVKGLVFTWADGVIRGDGWGGLNVKDNLLNFDCLYQAYSSDAEQTTTVLRATAYGGIVGGEDISSIINNPGNNPDLDSPANQNASGQYTVQITNDQSDGMDLVVELTQAGGLNRSHVIIIDDSAKKLSLPYTIFNLGLGDVASADAYYKIIVGQGKNFIAANKFLSQVIVQENLVSTQKEPFTYDTSVYFRGGQCQALILIASITPR